jgi:hypothetical protein
MELVTMYYRCMHGMFYSVANHVIDDPHGLTHGRGLEAHVAHALQQILGGDRALELVEVHIFHLLGIFGHLLGLDEDGVGGRRGRRMGGVHGFDIGDSKRVCKRIFESKNMLVIEACRIWVVDKNNV